MTNENIHMNKCCTNEIFVRTNVHEYRAFLLLWVRTNAPKFNCTNSLVLVCAYLTNHVIDITVDIIVCAFAFV